MLGSALTAAQPQRLIDCWECSELPTPLCRAVRGPQPCVQLTQLSSVHSVRPSSLRALC